MLKKYEKIIVSGCSFTEGFGLEDKTKAWPYILGNKIDCEVINLAENGIGNSRILYKTLEFYEKNPHYKHNSLLIVGLTNFSRQDFYDIRNAKNWSTIPNFDIDNIFVQYFWNFLYDETHYYKKFLYDLILYQNYYLTSGIRYFLFDALPGNFSSDKNLKDDDKFLIEKINKDFYPWWNKFCSNELINHPNYKLPDGHPNEAGHQEICSALLSSIKFIIN